VSFIDDIKKYQHPIYGVVGLYPNPSMGREIDNYHLFTAHALNLLEGLEQPGWLSLANSHEKFIAACDYVLVKRWPGDRGATSWDEIIGAAFTAWSANIPVSRELLWYGRGNSWFWDLEQPEKPRLRFWMARNLCFVPFIRACAGEKVGILAQLQWGLGALLSLLTPRDNTSGKLLVHIQLRPMAETGGIARLAIAIWRWRMSKQYSGPRELFSIYFPGHPLAGFQPKEF